MPFSLSARRSVPAARRQARKDRAGGRNKTEAASAPRGEPGARSERWRLSWNVWGGICENGVLGVENSQFSVPERKNSAPPESCLYFKNVRNKSLGNRTLQRAGGPPPQQKPRPDDRLREPFQGRFGVSPAVVEHKVFPPTATVSTENLSGKDFLGAIVLERAGCLVSAEVHLMAYLEALSSDTSLKGA